MIETVTTIIPTFQRPRLLRRAIRSALAQTHYDVRVCVYDNASGDETAQVVQHLAGGDMRVSYYAHPHQVNIRENFRFGMERVTTPFFSFLSDDDVLFPNFYTSALAQLRAHPQALFAAGSAIEFDQRGSVRYAPLAFWAREGVYAPPEGLTAMLGNRHPTWTGILFRSEVRDKVGLLDTNIAGPMDLDYELQIAARHPYVVFYEPSAGYVHHLERVSAVEDVSVIAGYRQMTDKLVRDERLDNAQRRLISRLLQRQMCAKLIEIAVKSLVTRKDANARAAAESLRRDFKRGVLAALLETAAYVCRKVQVFRWALAQLEELRLRLRSAATRGRLRVTTGGDGSAFARFLSG